MTMAKKIVVIGLISAAVIAALFVVRYDQDVTANSRLFLACDTEGAWEGLERWRRRFSSSEFDLAAGKVYAKYFKSGDVGGGDAHQLPSNHIFREMRVINPVGKGRMACGTGDYLAIDPHVRGHFDEPTDRFDPRKGHSISFTIKPGRKLKHLAATFTPINECKYPPKSRG